MGKIVLEVGLGRKSKNSLLTYEPGGWICESVAQVRAEVRI